MGNKSIIILTVILLIAAATGAFLRYNAQAKAKQYALSSWEGDHMLLAHCSR